MSHLWLTLEREVSHLWLTCKRSESFVIDLWEREVNHLWLTYERETICVCLSEGEDKFSLLWLTQEEKEQVIGGYGRQSAVMYYICVITLTINITYINKIKLFMHLPNSLCMWVCLFTVTELT